MHITAQTRASDSLTPAQREALDAHTRTINDDDYECSDNTRLARKGNAAEEAAYADAQAHGCCGFYDVEIPCADGTTLLYGFNYGH